MGEANLNAAPRFLTIKDVAEELATADSTVRKMIQTGDLPAIQIGGRGIWRVERSKLEEFISAQYGRAEADRVKLDNFESAEE